MLAYIGILGMLTSSNSWFDIWSIIRGYNKPRINIGMYLLYIVGATSQFAYTLHLYDPILYIPMGLDVLSTLLLLSIVGYQRCRFSPGIVTTTIFDSDLSTPIYSRVPVSDPELESQHSDLNDGT